MSKEKGGVISYLDSNYFYQQADTLLVCARPPCPEQIAQLFSHEPSTYSFKDLPIAIVSSTYSSLVAI